LSDDLDELAVRRQELNTRAENLLAELRQHRPFGSRLGKNSKGLRSNRRLASLKNVRQSSPATSAQTLTDSLRRTSFCLSRMTARTMRALITTGACVEPKVTLLERERSRPRPLIRDVSFRQDRGTTVLMPRYTRDANIYVCFWPSRSTSAAAAACSSQDVGLITRSCLAGNNDMRIPTDAAHQHERLSRVPRCLRCDTSRYQFRLAITPSRDATEPCSTFA
jgi:hypothetical protein